MNSINEKIRKSSKTMALITRVLMIICAISIIVPIILITVFANKTDADLSIINGLSMWSSSGNLIVERDAAIAELSTAIVSEILLLLVFINAYRMFASICKEGTPFTEFVIKALRKNGILMIVYFFVTPIARYSFYASITHGTTTMTSFNIVYIVLALVFFFISTIFKYGAELQHQSDETL